MKAGQSNDLTRRQACRPAHQVVAEDFQVHVGPVAAVDADGAVAVLWPGAEHRAPSGRAQQHLGAYAVSSCIVDVQTQAACSCTSTIIRTNLG